MTSWHAGHVGLVTALTLSLTGCSLQGDDVKQVSARSGVSVLAGSPTAPGDPSYAVPAPGPLKKDVLRADLLLVSDRTLPAAVRHELERTRGVHAAAPLSLASVPVAGRTITIGAVDPASYRRFTPENTARMDAVWQRVAAGEIALAPETGAALNQPLGGQMMLGNHQGALQVRVGAFASMAPRIDAVVNEPRGRQLGMLPGNALLVSTGQAAPSDVAERIERVTDRHVTVQQLAADPAGAGTQTAFLTGGSVGQAVGSFSYRYFEDGAVAPDQAWVGANIRTEDVPILGQVTCHRMTLPQLRAAMQEVVDAGLASSVDASDFGGCYAPRFIAHDPAKGLSLHTWGIALDLNVAGNQRGTAGEMDPRVVSILKQWGFAWGGDWEYTDPMHFELAALTEPR